MNNLENADTSSKPRRYELRNLNKILVDSLEIGKKQLVVSLENLKSKSKLQNEIDQTVLELQKQQVPRPKRKKHVNRYHTSEGDLIWDGSVINNLNDITVKPVTLHERVLKFDERISVPIIERGKTRIVTRKIKKCVELSSSEKSEIRTTSLESGPKTLTLPVNTHDKEILPEHKILSSKASERGVFREIIQKSKRQKFQRDDNVYEDTLQDTYFKRLRDSGNIRAIPDDARKRVQLSQVKPESEFWDTRGETLLGYDFVAGTLDNARLHVLSLSDSYLKNIHTFREQNKKECFDQTNATNTTSVIFNEKLDSSASCMHKYRTCENKSKDVTCNICKLIVQKKAEIPKLTRISLAKPAKSLSDELTFDQFDPRSMALTKNCSRNKSRLKYGCPLGH